MYPDWAGNAWIYSRKVDDDLLCNTNTLKSVRSVVGAVLALFVK